ncbi:hypothetical protein LguiA_007287 [Lonicera macranthoides]
MDLRAPPLPLPSLSSLFELNLPLVKASNILTNFGCTVNFTPLIGALLANSFAAVEKFEKIYTFDPKPFLIIPNGYMATLTFIPPPPPQPPPPLNRHPTTLTSLFSMATHEISSPPTSYKINEALKI